MQRIYGFSRVEETGAPAPNAIVQVFQTGTLTPATIYSDNLSTPKANPFLCDQFGYFYFYANNSRVDITISGGGVNTPYTLADVVLNDVFTLNGLTQTPQTMVTGTAGTDFAIVDAVSVHTFNLPDAGAAARGVVTTGAQTFAGAKTFSTPIAVGSGGTGVSTVPANGAVPIGNGAGYVVTTLTGTANQVSVANGAGSITLSTPQNIHTGASPTFVGLTLSGLTTNRILISTGGVISATAAATNGQVLIGSTGSAPVWTSITAGANITITPGAGTLSIAGAGGISSLNGLSGATQTFAVSSAGADFAISSVGTTHTFKLPDAGTAARGLVTSGNQNFAGVKTLDRPWEFAPTPGAAVSLAVQGTLIGGVSAQPVTNTAGSVETDLFTFTLGTGPLSVVDSILRLTVFGTCANNAHAKTLKVYAGATVIATFTLSTSAVRHWKIECLYAQQNPGGPLVNTLAILTQGTTTFTGTVGSGTPAVTSGVVKVTGTASGGADITKFGGFVEWIGN